MRCDVFLQKRSTTTTRATSYMKTSLTENQISTMSNTYALHSLPFELLFLYVCMAYVEIDRFEAPVGGFFLVQEELLQL